MLLDAAADYESPFVSVVVADGSIRAHGIDTSIRRRFTDGIEIGAAYSYWREEQLSAYGHGTGFPWERWLPADYDIRNQVRVDFAYEAPGTWRFGTLFRYASGRPYTPYNVAASIRAYTGITDISSFNGATYPPYHRLDMRVDRIFAIGRTRLAVYGEIDNVYNHDNLYVYELSRVAREPRPIYQWGRLPVAGIRWEF